MAKILIVDDDPAIASCISTLLIQALHTPVAVDSLARAREVLESDPEIALLVLDNQFSLHETGISFLTYLRRYSNHRTLPVVVCSGDTKPESVTGFASLSISAFVVKPFKPTRLLAEVERVLQKLAAA